MSERELGKTKIPAVVTLLAAMLLIAVLYTINPARHESVAPHAFSPAATASFEWRDR
jgi:hypothetical protein